MTMAAVTIDCATPRITAIRNSARLRARSPTASERAINVVIALSRPEHTDLADDVSGRPGNGEYAERCRPEQPRDEKCEDAAEIRRQHRDRVQERAAF